MTLKEQIKKICGNRYSYIFNSTYVTEKEYNRIMRQLMCRLIDVEDMFPGEYDFYDEVRDEYFSDFLREEDYRHYSYMVEWPENDIYRLIITDYYTDKRNDIVIEIPSFLLEDNWIDNVESLQTHRRIKEIDKEINKIEVIMTSGTGQIMELNKEKEELELKLRELK